MRTWSRRNWSLPCAAAILWLVTGLLLVQCLSLNRGEFAFTLDDAYIHLAFAKNLGRFGVFGVTPFEFSSSESSLLWGCLLGGIYKIVPVPAVFVYVPLLLNLALSTVLLAIGYRICTGEDDGSTARQAGAFFVLLALIFVTPLPWLIFTGMEHVLQTVLTVGFVFLAAHRLSHNGADRRRDAGLLLLAPLLTAVRYEGLFPLIAVCLLFLLRGRAGRALGLGIAGLLPLAMYGLISAHEGWFWLPNSVLLKSRFGDPGMRYLIGLMPRPMALFQLAERPYLLLLFALASLLLLIRCARIRSDREASLWHPAQLFTFVFLFATLAHLQSALLRPLPGGFVLWYTRYDAYLVVLGLLATTLQVRALAGDREFLLRAAGMHPALPVLLRAYAVVLTLGAVLVFQPRAVQSLIRIPPASQNIYAQQCQMARFVKRYYDGQTVALNDIGAVNYRADIRCVDLVGLGSRDVAAAKLAGVYDTQAIAAITAAQRVKIAIVYAPWFRYLGGLPGEWKETGRWTLRRNVICGDPTVSFYAVDPGERDRLAAGLRQFAPLLPGDVLQRITQ